MHEKNNLHWEYVPFISSTPFPTRSQQIPLFPVLHSRLDPYWCPVPGSIYSGLFSRSSLAHSGSMDCKKLAIQSLQNFCQNFPETNFIRDVMMKHNSGMMVKLRCAPCCWNCDRVHFQNSRDVSNRTLILAHSANFVHSADLIRDNFPPKWNSQWTEFGNRCFSPLPEEGVKLSQKILRKKGGNILFKVNWVVNVVFPAIYLMPFSIPRVYHSFLVPFTNKTKVKWPAGGSLT